jgi:Transglycosylase SLT domain
VVYPRLFILALLVNQFAMVAAAAGELTNHRERMALSGNIRAGHLATTKAAAMSPPAPLDRVANAVDGAESSFGHDLGMWRSDPSGPQGPMQVSEAAASDVGGGDRFDLTQNRVLGRAYLARLYRRYNNWPDAIAAYNWGLGKVDSWIRAGRPSEKLQAGVAAYTTRVLRDSGLCHGAEKRQLRGSAIFGDNPEFRTVADRSAPARLVSSNDNGARFTGNDPYSCGTALRPISKIPVYGDRPAESPFERLTTSARTSWNAAIHGVRFTNSARQTLQPRGCNYSFLTSGHSPCSIGRNASSPGMVRTDL